MAKRSARARRESKERAARLRPVVREAAGLALLAVGLLGLVALATYSRHDPVWTVAPVANRAGVIGATLAGLLRGAVGVAAWVPIGVAIVLGAKWLAGLGSPRPRFFVGATLLLLALAPLPALLSGAEYSSETLAVAGRFGARLAHGEQLWLSDWGARLVNLLLATVGALFVFGVAAGRAAALLGRLTLLAGLGLTRLAAAVASTTQLAFHQTLRGAATLGGGLQHAWQSFWIWRERRARRARVAAIREPELGEPAAGEMEPSAPPRRRGPSPAIVDHIAERRESEEPRQEAFAFSERSRSSGPYQLPDVSVFQRPAAGSRRYDRDSLIMNSRILEKKLQDFGVLGRVVTVHPGPVITMYEFEPASGVKVNRIVNLADDLALALRALSVRIIAPLPGKSVVGIEVPNAEREIVYIRDLLEADSLRQNPSKLTIALGKDIFGNPVETDLAKMPHLLVAGATGTGKSVFLNALLCSILCRATPGELKLLLIDPKLLELSVYEGIPHLIADVVTNPKRAAAALAGIVHKMEQRYHRMAALGVRNIHQYNERVEKLLTEGQTTFRLKAKPGEEEGEEIPLEHLPFIVVVIDELADLMVVSARDVEEALQRLAQMARAAGIHLVLATQRPSVDVLTGVIKANFPARISFQVSSRTDSRTILDQNGAEHLLGQGDMLFLPPGTSKLQRIHGAFVSEREVADLSAALRKQGAPEFDDTLLRLKEESEAKEQRGEDTDDLYDRAVAIVAETRNASISYLQRRLKVGYNRAARMIEQMEEQQVVGPQEGTRPREVYVRPLDLE